MLRRMVGGSPGLVDMKGLVESQADLERFCCVRESHPELETLVGARQLPLQLLSFVGIL